MMTLIMKIIKGMINMVIKIGVTVIITEINGSSMIIKNIYENIDNNDYQNDNSKQWEKQY